MSSGDSIQWWTVILQPLYPGPMSVCPGQPILLEKKKTISVFPASWFSIAAFVPAIFQSCFSLPIHSVNPDTSLINCFALKITSYINFVILPPRILADNQLKTGLYCLFIASFLLGPALLLQVFGE